MAKTTIIDAIIDGYLPPYRWVIKGQKKEIEALLADNSCLSAENGALETALYDVLGATTLAKAKVIADKALPTERVSTEQTPVCPETAIEKDNQKRDGDRQ